MCNISPSAPVKGSSRSLSNIEGVHQLCAVVSSCDVRCVTCQNRLQNRRLAVSIVEHRYHYTAVSNMATPSWEQQFTCKWFNPGRLDMSGFPKDMPTCLKFYLTSLRSEEWTKALEMIQVGEGHCFADETGIVFPAGYESPSEEEEQRPLYGDEETGIVFPVDCESYSSSSSEEEEQSKGPLHEDEVAIFAGCFSEDRVKKSVFLSIVQKCLEERRKQCQCDALDGEEQFRNYIQRGTKPTSAADLHVPSQESTVQNEKSEGIQRTISLDNLTALLETPKQSNISLLLNSLDLATNITDEDLGFTDWATDPNTKQLALEMKKMALELTGLEAKHEIARRQVELKEEMVKSLQSKVTRLTQEKAHKVLSEEGKSVMGVSSTSEFTVPITTNSVEAIEDLIGNNYTLLRKRLQVEKLIPHFIERGLLDFEDKQVVMSKTTTPGKAEALLDLLADNGTCTPENFLEILNNGDHRHVAVQLKRITTRNENAGTQVFICHAGPDKARFVRPLVQKLQERGRLPMVEIFFEEISLSPGVDIAAEIKATLLSSSVKLVVFVISHHVLNDRYWPKLEFELTLRKNKKIFSIWLDQNDDDFTAFGNRLRKYSPTLKETVGP
uniref:Uncharacterized protein n=1 Tax=Branchiostoma floridae TaxID=7739 RepID=C3YZ62_BRAFL|eukprot:XP_002598558.1 hypothetical protein BRAFLDRAFT_66949 [Branchiostoma floridae]